MKVDPRGGASQVKVRLLFPNCKRKARKNIQLFLYTFCTSFFFFIFFFTTVEERGNCCPKTWHGKNFFFRATLHYFFSLCKAVVLALPLTISSLFRRKRRGEKAFWQTQTIWDVFRKRAKIHQQFRLLEFFLLEIQLSKDGTLMWKERRRRAQLDYHYEICKHIFFMQQCNFMSQFCVADS